MKLKSQSKKDVKESGLITKTAIKAGIACGNFDGEEPICWNTTECDGIGAWKYYEPEIQANVTWSG